MISLLASSSTWRRAAAVALCAAPAASPEDDDGGLTSLLMQRAVQTCCCTYRTCRDPPTAQWLSDVAGVPEQVHSIDGLPTPWRSWLLDLLSSPKVEIEVESVLKRHRGISANNPYLQPSAMTYVYTISPAEVGERVIQTALQLAVEWAEDLGRLEAEAEGVWRMRRAIVLDDDAEVKTTLPAFSIEQDGGEPAKSSIQLFPTAYHRCPLFPSEHVFSPCGKNYGVPACAYLQVTTRRFVAETMTCSRHSRRGRQPRQPSHRCAGAPKMPPPLRCCMLTGRHSESSLLATSRCTQARASCTSCSSSR